MYAMQTMSFLAYVLRGFSAALKKYHAFIPEFVVRLLKDCPRELSASRKELLVATRHILSTDFRSIFVPKVDVLLNEKVLIGDGLTVHETLRYSKHLLKSFFTLLMKYTGRWLTVWLQTCCIMSERS